MKKIILIPIALFLLVSYCPAKTFSFNPDTIRKAATEKDTSKTRNQPPFNADVYLNGTMDPLPVSSDILKSHTEEYTEKHIMAIGKVYTGTLSEKDGITMLYIGGNYPNQNLLVVIKKRNRAKFGHPETDLIGQEIGVTGYVSHYKGMLAIKLSRPEDLQYLSHPIKKGISP